MIASSLLDIPRGKKGALALRADEYLAQFLDILAKLEPSVPASESGPSNSASSETEVAAAAAAEEAEFRNWADLREYQLHFVKTGGFFG